MSVGHTISARRCGILILWTILIAGCCLVSGAVVRAAAPETVVIFSEENIRFKPDDTLLCSEGVTADDNGRVITTSVDLPVYEGPVKITAHLTLYPIPKDIQFVHDKWDRAGNVRLAIDDGPDIEIVKFITAYGGFTEWEVDVSHLAPLLKGKGTVRAFIDTWVNPAWKMDFKLEYEPTEEVVNPAWTEGMLFVESYDVRSFGSEGTEVEITVPEGMRRVMMYYYVSGHCTDGRGADEFEQKDNVIYVDGRSVYRFRPWRDDCREFREINPYCRRWSDGWWSSDFSRSGWCPGDVVSPVEIDLSDHLKAGTHKVRFAIENVRPVDEDGQYGYWRISSQLIGWK